MSEEEDRYGAGARGARSNEATARSQDDEETNMGFSDNTSEIVCASSINLAEVMTQKYFQPSTLEGQPMYIEDASPNTSIIDAPIETGESLQVPLRPSSVETVVIPISPTTAAKLDPGTGVLVPGPTTKKSTGDHTRPRISTDNKKPELSATEMLLLSMAETLNQKCLILCLNFF